MEPTKFEVNVKQSSLIIRKLPGGEPSGLFAVKGSILTIIKEENGWSGLAGGGWVSTQFLVKVSETIEPPKPGAQFKFISFPQRFGQSWFYYNYYMCAIYHNRFLT